MSDKRIELLTSRIRDIPDFPKPGIIFKDITPLLADPQAFATSLEMFEERYKDEGVDVIVGIESRGFMFGAALANKMNKSFVPVRKPGKLPAATYRCEYELEYGTDACEIHQDAIPKGAKVLVIDDLLATGGTARATAELVGRAGGEVVGIAFVIELTFLNGAEKLSPFPPYSLIKY